MQNKTEQECRNEPPLPPSPRPDAPITMSYYPDGRQEELLASGGAPTRGFGLFVATLWENDWKPPIFLRKGGTENSKRTVGFGRIVVSERKFPHLSVNLVRKGWMSGGAKRECERTLTVKLTGLAQTLDRLKTLIGIFSQTAGPTCEFWANPVDFAF